MEKQKPGIARAQAYLVDQASERYRGRRWPSIRALAAEAGVSFVTMWKALRQLELEGRLTLDSQGNRTFSGLGGNSVSQIVTASSEAPHSLAVPASLYLTEKLYRDIVCGRFRDGEKLPSCKELQQQYGISFATLKKSLTSLVSDRIIEQRSDGYYVPSLTGSKTHARIVVIGCGWEDGKIWVDYQDKNYFRALESECIRLSIKLDVVVYYRDHHRLRFVHTASRTEYDLSDRMIIGYVFIVANLDSTPEEVLERLAPLRRCVAVLDVVGGWKVPRCARGNRQIRFFTATASVHPARQVAHYLLENGHHRVAFFSPFHRALWSQRRYDTIVEMFDRAGLPNGVVPFLRTTSAYQWDYLRKPEHHEDIQSLINQYSVWKNEAQGEIFKRFGNLGYNFARYITEWNCASGEIYEKMRPFFESALEDSSITAWVMANDFSATIAIDFLKKRGVKIPEELSVISFDNTLDAMEYQLTSYDFNNQGIITMMLRFILAPATIKPARGNGCIEVDGTLVVRRSTAAIAQRKKTVP